MNETITSEIEVQEEILEILRRRYQDGISYFEARRILNEVANVFGNTDIPMSNIHLSD